jgi:hypothetical protein
VCERFTSLHFNRAFRQNHQFATHTLQPLTDAPDSNFKQSDAFHSDQAKFVTGVALPLDDQSSRIVSEPSSEIPRGFDRIPQDVRDWLRLLNTLSAGDLSSCDVPGAMISA